MKKLLSLIFSAAVSVAASAQGWAPAGNNIRTRWAAEVSPSNAHPEYPRPQMERPDWQSLNGLWSYSVQDATDEAMTQAQGDILVPFCIESSLSGVGRTISEEEALWYSRTFTVPSDWKRKKVILNFDAVDWGCEVWVNGKSVGSHTGGYTAFSFDITKALKRKGEQILTVKVIDATENEFQPHGKQVRNPRGIWYTSVSGIWQSVWMEAVSKKGYIKDYQVETDIVEGTVTVTPEVDGKVKKYVLELDGKTVVGANGEALTIKVHNPRLWTPETPEIYNFTIKALKGRKVLDEVSCYTTLRKISMVKDSEGHMRMALNDRPLFQYGPLDQGWWPDGLYTAPTDEALKYDLVMTKELGFNMIRKHIKVEPSRWFYYCDQLGILVWQDMPSIDYHSKNIWSQKVKNDKGENDFDLGTDYPLSEEGKANYYKEWAEIINQVKKFQCVVCWVPFNEAWCQFDTKAVAEFTKDLDPSRLVNAASGGNWVSGHVGDLLDSHYYPMPKMRIWDPEMVNVLGEYGGIGLPIEGHVWEIDRKWGYVQYKTPEEVTDAYVEYTGQLIPIVKEGCSAAVYTQTTDVEGEVNGLMTYDREITKVEVGRIAEANAAVIRAMVE